MTNVYAGWYPDPHSPGQQRYFDGNAWTNYRISPPAGERSADWYPDPEGRPSRRYWDGTVWTDHYAELESKPLGTHPALGMHPAAMILILLFSAIVVVSTSVQVGIGAGVVFAIFLAIFFGGIWLAFRSDARRNQRQQVQDRNVGITINADIEHSAYLQNDDKRGTYGQFPPAS